MWKKILKVSIYIFSGLLALSVSLVIYYQFDDELEPDVVAVLSYQPPQVTASQNGYYHVLGLFAAKDKIPHEHGLSIIEVGRQRYEAGEDIMTFSFTDHDEMSSLKPDVEAANYCDFEESHCLGNIRDNLKKIEVVIARNQVLIDRYKSAYRYPEFQETPYVFGFNSVITTHKLVLTSIAHQWAKGDRKQAIDLLAQDIAFLRKVNASEISLLTRMIFFAMIRNNLTLFSELISDCKDSTLRELIHQAIEKPFSKNELSLRKIMGIEFRHQTYFFEKKYPEDVEKSVLSRLFDVFIYKPNALKNKIYSNRREAIKFSECDIEQYLQCKDAYLERSSELQDYISWSFIDDPAGSIFQAMGASGYSGYVRQQFVIEAKRHLIVVKSKIYKDMVGREQIETYLSELSRPYRNPFTGKPIQYNKSENVLVIESDADEHISITVKL